MSERGLFRPDKTCDQFNGFEVDGVMCFIHHQPRRWPPSHPEGVRMLICPGLMY